MARSSTGFAFQCAGRVDHVGAVGDELECADAVAPDGREQAVGIGSAGADYLRHPAAQGVGIGEQVLEHGSDRFAPVCALAQRQGQRHRQRVLPGETACVVLKADGLARLLEEMTDQAVVEMDVERRVKPAARHQKIASMSAARLVVRGTIRNSRSRAARTARIVSSLAAGLPVSIREIVSCRSPALSPSCVWFQPRCLRARWTRVPICFGGAGQIRHAGIMT